GVSRSVGRVDADTIAAEAIQAARLRFADVAFELTLEGTAVVRADRARLLQVLGNLIDNAVKYSPPSASVDVEVQLLGDRVRFAVSDRGLGIPVADRDRVFDKFFRLDPHLARGVGGTGRGLSISRQLGELMAGFIGAEARGGGGSTFLVDLPPGCPAPTPAAAPRFAVSGAAGPPRAVLALPRGARAARARRR